MINPGQINRWLSERLSPQLRQWLWERKVALGNRRIRELGPHYSKQIHEVWQNDLDVFTSIHTKVDWEDFRDERIDALRRALGVNEANADIPKSMVTGILERDGYQIESIVFGGHMDLPVSANIYRPIQFTHKNPAIIMCHSHHDSKNEEELQCMGMTWAQQGCIVLIMDLLGHGERRQHPFVSSSDYPEDFRIDKQDYYFRSVLSMQLELVGESLMGWMVQDVRCGIDLLWADPQIDREKIIVIGAVAGGGDIAAVVGALDERVSAVVAFNFGHVSLGDWDLTRNLPDTARCGFWPWVILASLSPRRLIYGREFSWDSQHDIVWQHLLKVYGFYDRDDALRSVHGSGRGSRQGSLDSHCTNVGQIHRAQLYPIFQEWFGISMPEEEVSRHIERKRLASLTADSGRVFGVRRVHEVAQEICQQQLMAARALRAARPSRGQAVRLQDELSEVLGPMTPFTSFRVQSKRKSLGSVEYVVLEMERTVCVRLQLFYPSDLKDTTRPVVIAFAQEGNLCLKRARQVDIQNLLHQGVVVCLAELRGIGDGRHGEIYRGRISPSASMTSSSLMIGESLLCSRVRDLRTIMTYLEKCEGFDMKRVGLWGDSLAIPNPQDCNMVVPLDASSFPMKGEPLGGVLALLSALYEPHVRAVYIHGGLLSYSALLNSPFLYQPADSIIHHILRIADLPDIAAALAPLPVCIDGLVDGGNRLVRQNEVELAYHMARAQYVSAECSDRLLLEGERAVAGNIWKWFKAFL